MHEPWLDRRRIAAFLRVVAGGVLVATCLAAQAASSGWQPGAGFRFQELPEPGSGPASIAAATTNRAGFVPVPGTVTGIAFSNTLPVALMMENNNLMNGSGAAAGDIDGDGLCDLFFAAIHGTNALYRNRGNWQFEDITKQAGVGGAGGHSTGALFGDLDGDGDLDLLVATLGRGVLSFENLGQGRFRDVTATAGLAADTGSTSLAMADVDGDGDLDLYVANYGSLSILRSGGRADMKMVDGKWEVSGPYAKRLRFVDGRLEEVGEPDVLYLNDGQGHFRPLPWNSEFFLDEQGQPKPAPWDFGLTVQMRDLNGDRAPDIYVCNDFQTVDRIWLNDGRGRFRALPRLAMRKQSFSSMGVDFGDLDRDGDLDFFVTEMMSRDPRLRLRQVVGMAPLVPEPGRVENRPEVGRNTLFLNWGDNTFAEIAQYSGVAAADWAWQPVLLDVDLDGFEDILVGNGMRFDVQDRDVLAAIRSLGRQTPEQSRTNLAMYPGFVTANLAWRNRHDLTFEDASAAWGFGNVRITQGIVQADLDNDGDLDLALNGIDGGALLLRNEATAPRLAVRLRGRTPNGRGVGGLIRVLGGPVPMQLQEMLCGGHYLSCSDTLRVFAVGNATNDLAIEVRWRGGATTTLAHARPNRVYEIEEPAAGPADAPPAPKPEPWFQDVSERLGHVHREIAFADYQRQPLLTKQLSQLGPGVAWFDLDGDGRDELVIGGAKGGLIDVFAWNGTNRFDRIPSPTNRMAPDDLTGLAGWISAKGERAVLLGLSHYESKQPPSSSVVLGLLGAGPTPFGVRPATGIPGIESAPGPLAVADVDGDGDLDLFVGGRVIPGAYPAPAVSRVFMQAPDGFRLDEPRTRALADVGLVSGAVWSDLDADGLPDLVLACEWGPVRIFHNQGGRLVEETEALGLATLTGWWNGVVTGDFDEDGRLDIVASNWGLNTPWQADAEHPTRLYFGDLAGLGVIDLVETCYSTEAGADLPMRNLNALSQAFPMLLGQFPTHRAFASATARQILEALPHPARSVAATTLASMIFLNRQSNFVARVLPPEAQFAPAFAVNVGDADADGHEDLFLSQNFFALRPEVPRLDGGRGLWLRGNGRGEFRAVPGQESGVRVHGEQRGAALADFDEDGRVDLVVTQNGGPTCLFRNAVPRRGVRIKLRGPPGNPLGYGARLRLWSGPHAGPVREVHGGSGYWSQDSATSVLASAAPVTAIEVLWPGGRVVKGPLAADTLECVVSVDGTVRPTR